MAKRTIQQTAVWATVVIILAAGWYYWSRPPKEIIEPPVWDDPPTIDPVFAENTAQSLYDAMQGIGTDEEALRSIYDSLVALNLNPIDLWMIWEDFDSIVAAQSSYSDNLGGWLNSELSSTGDDGTLLNDYRVLFAPIAAF
jgi:hypothetical protein